MLSNEAYSYSSSPSEKAWLKFNNFSIFLDLELELLDSNSPTPIVSLPFPCVEAKVAPPPFLKLEKI